jgi:hypothetical protein
MTMFCSQWSLPEDAVRGAKVGGSNPPGAKFDAHVREYDDLHRGVVRCVRWNTPDVDDVINDESTMNNSNGLGGALFASCGNDGCVAVVDTRLPTNRAKVAGVDGAHGGRAVNFVEWGRGAGSAFSPGGGIKKHKISFPFVADVADVGRGCLRPALGPPSPGRTFGRGTAPKK